MPSGEAGSQDAMQLVSRTGKTESEISCETVQTQSSGVYTLHQEQESDSSSELGITTTSYMTLSHTSKLIEKRPYPPPPT